RRGMIAVLVLHAFEDRELATRSEMDLELAATVDDMIVDALAVLTVRLAAGVPVAFEDLVRVRCERRKDGIVLPLRRGGGGGEHERTSEEPGCPGGRLTHGVRRSFPVRSLRADYHRIGALTHN